MMQMDQNEKAGKFVEEAKKLMQGDEDDGGQRVEESKGPGIKSGMKLGKGKK